MQLDHSLSWLALALTPGLAARLSARLLRQFGSPEGVFRASPPDLEACHLPAETAQAILKKAAFPRAEKELAGVRKIAGCMLLNWTEPEYPQTLLQIYDPPVLLYVRGDLQVLNLPSLSIVGTRKPTLYGTQMAQRLGRDLAARGLVIVSGLARGIDAIGHQGAMDAHGRAIGILGTGIDVCYPKENKKLYEKVLERGAIISELPLRTHPAPENFPVRNRIVAGLPLGVVVVEGAQYSGSLITARLAMEFGREVFGVPGNVTQPVSFAPNQLIKQGAKLVTCAEDVIEELPTPVRAALVQAEQPEAEQRNLLVGAALNGSEKKLYELLNAEEPVPIDDIVERSGLNSSDVLATLFNLEMKGIVRQLPGKQFCKVLL
ncbi:MAG: DNA protecting protein DprA [Acidobacteria bacterium 13_1_40CM_4_58_4]|nr:MAG: DNA protecting protein DprA [Acidobacteria bacterium 13_1_40CM_4_58_4]